MEGLTIKNRTSFLIDSLLNSNSKELGDVENTENEEEEKESLQNIPKLEKEVHDNEECYVNKESPSMTRGSLTPPEIPTFPHLTIPSIMNQTTNNNFLIKIIENSQQIQAAQLAHMNTRFRLMSQAAVMANSMNHLPKPFTTPFLTTTPTTFHLPNIFNMKNLLMRDKNNGNNGTLRSHPSTSYSSNNVKKYKCDVCEKTFSRSNTLITHKVSKSFFF